MSQLLTSGWKYNLDKIQCTGTIKRAYYGVSQCPRMDLNKKSGPEQKTTTG